MEPRKRVFQSTALVSSIVLVGGFIGCSAGVVMFLGGSKSNPMFQVAPVKRPVEPPQPAAPAAQSTDRSSLPAD
jgi:hypothetical protein